MAVFRCKLAWISGVILSGLVLPAAGAQARSAPKPVTGPAVQQKFFGKWRLDRSKTRKVHTGDDDEAIQWRSYEQDGERVKVSWGNGEKLAGSYSAKCDGTVESVGSGDIRCWQVDPRTIEGEQLDKSDPMHRYYRRSVSRDGKSMTITWYADPKRSRRSDRFVYAKY